MELTLYANTNSTSSNAINLINYAMSFNSFKDADYVVFQDSQYSYYIVWGDLEVEGERVYSVGDGDVEYIHYYRSSGSDYTNTYLYQYSVTDSFSLNKGEYVPTSNIPTVGFMSDTYNTYANYQLFGEFLILAVSFLFVIMLKSLRSFKQ